MLLIFNLEKAKYLQKKFNSKFKERKRVSDADVQFFDLEDANQGQPKEGSLNGSAAGDEDIDGNIEPDLNKCKLLLAQDKSLHR